MSDFKTTPIKNSYELMIDRLKAVISDKDAELARLTLHRAQGSGYKYCARADTPNVGGRGVTEVERPGAKRPVATITTAKSNSLRSKVKPKPLAVKAARSRCHGAGRDAMHL